MASLKKEDLIGSLAGNLAMVAVGYFGVIKPILNALGITDPLSEKLAQADVKKASISYLNPAYAINIQNKYGPSLYKQSRTLVPTVDSFFKERALEIWSAKGTFNDNEAKVIEFAKRFKSKYQLSEFCAYFAKESGLGDFVGFLQTFMKAYEIKNYCLTYWAKLPDAYTVSFGYGAADYKILKAEL